MNTNEITWSVIRPCLQLASYQLRDQIIIPSLCIAETPSARAEEELYIKNGIQGGTHSRGTSLLINGKNIAYSKKILERLARTAVSPETACCYTCSDYPYLQKARAVWKQFLAGRDNEKHALSELASSLCRQSYAIELEFENTGILLEELLQRTNAQGDLYDTLSVLSILATTWPFWKNAGKGRDGAADRLIRQLCDMLFPHTSQNQSLPAGISIPENSAESLYDSALYKYRTGDYDAAGELFVKIIRDHLTASHSILSDSFDKLNECCSRGYNKPADIGSAETLRYWARWYGSPYAKNRTHTIREIPERAAASFRGTCISNCENSVYSWICETKPENWSMCSADDPSACFRPEQNTRFLLIKEDYEANVKDALVILDRIKHVLEETGSDLKEIGQTEIVIRCEQESATPLLDTACSFLDENTADPSAIWADHPIRIYLLDEAKRSADYLFAKHPLFYPLTFKSGAGNPKSHALNLVIVSDNPDFCCVSWLVRDAFWMLPGIPEIPRSKITVLSPYAESIAEKVTSQCPGFSSFTRINGGTAEPEKGRARRVHPVNISDISFPEIEYRTVSLQGRAFVSLLEEFSISDDLFYYVVESVSDLESISLASKIREVSIKKNVLCEETQGRRISRYSSDPTVIAVKCSDPDLAGLAEDLIVPKETERENLWYNDYKLLSFASRKDLFSWTELTGGDIEFLSLCMHLQYCSSGRHNYLEAPSQEDLRSYYSRLYNRDSSFAEAMSMPYRLFAAGILPDIWYINNEETFWAAKNRAALAEKFEEQLKADRSLVEKLSRWEHSRWCCYMLSSGWLPASPNQVYAFMKSGVSRHTLQIARLHPCLCSWKQLKTLYNVLHYAYTGSSDIYGKFSYDQRFSRFKEEDNTYFQTLDADNIRQTGDILKAQPI